MITEFTWFYKFCKLKLSLKLLKETLSALYINCALAVWSRACWLVNMTKTRTKLKKRYYFIYI